MDSLGREIARERDELLKENEILRQQRDLYWLLLKRCHDVIYRARLIDNWDLMEELITQINAIKKP